jgi:peptidoglycan/LPS O-acetylase OafA/YrhL
MRAVAVLLVVADHLRTRVTGGYVGVDVFFVISGYLISSHIMSQVAHGRFSIVDFYERRIRRIFPALLVMLAVCCAAAYFYLLPVETKDFAKSLFAAIGSVSNILFWMQSGYFDAPSIHKPLLHTWSLAVEEQFYIFFPLFLMVTRTWSRERLRNALYAVTGISFLAACYWVKRDASASFFFAPLRAWELLFGTILSQGYLPSIRSSIARNVASLVGIALIVGPAIAFNGTTPFPGLAALPPCIGAGLIIAGGETGSSAVGRLLAWRPVVFIGLISYSLYLWHWPLIVFRSRALLLPDNDTLTPYSKLLLLVVSLAAGTLSWLLVERPFRTGNLRPGRTRLFVITGAGVAALLLFSTAMLTTNGMTARFPKSAIGVASFVNFHPTTQWREGECFLVSDNRFDRFNQQVCLPAKDTRNTVLLLGDSMAAQLYPGLKAAFPALQIAQATSADCRMFVQMQAEMQAAYAANCKQMSSLLYENWLVKNDVRAVLMAASWQERDLPQLAKTIQWLQEHGKRVIIFGPVQEFDTDFPRVLSFSERFKDSSLVNRHLDSRSKSLDERMAALAKAQWKVEYVSFFANVCTSSTPPSTQFGCPFYAALNVPLQFDGHHLTPEGSALYAISVRTKGQLL